MCTGIQLRTTSGAPIYGRTMEFATPLQSQALVIPKQVQFTGTGVQGLPGKTWSSLYTITGLNGLGLERIIDGINSEGLCVGAFYFVNYAGYQQVAPEDSANSMCSVDLPTYLLSTCTTVDEVKSAVTQIQINSSNPSGTGAALPLHYNVHDRLGNVLVIEYVGGNLSVLENPVGVLTNSPDYNWHLTNLSNYVNLSATDIVSWELKSAVDPAKTVSIFPAGQGSGFLGLPGDYTPPSRFIRAVAYSQFSSPVDTNQDAILQAFHILDAFDIPLGTIIDPTSKNPAEYTEWTVASDLVETKFYFHTEGDRTIRVIDLANWAFQGSRVEYLSIDQGPTIINMADLQKTGDIVAS
ncbi:choloylglycine hydrolase [Pedobacter sp. W3I1]|uniref:choloylglycine hydrolase family protein n=1 Tax=Pedobacter sp. W3I1 TaxID=3042291 RepID=UPI00278B32B4|nr:choloylglycine hydrolase family protein [Pedobacter sp. W3I1]MDQ0639931.1 choloylglycine hydrolase [Pedobacter sp. W3I1]